jgi:hypothetical protein
MPSVSAPQSQVVRGRLNVGFWGPIMAEFNAAIVRRIFGLPHRHQLKPVYSDAATGWLGRKAFLRD